MRAKTLRVNWLQAAVLKASRFESVQAAEASRRRRLVLTSGEIDAVVYLGRLDAPQAEVSAAKAATLWVDGV